MKGNTMKKWEIRHIGDEVSCPVIVEANIVDGNYVSILTVVEEDGVKFAAVYEEEDARLLVEAPEMCRLLREMHYCIGERLLDDIMGYDFKERLCAVLRRIEGGHSGTP